MRKYVIAFAISGLVVACAETGPTELPESVNFAVAGNSGCYTVTGRIIQTGVFPNFAGSIVGDIEGDVVTVLDPASVVTKGATIHLQGEQTWDVTGGIVPGLAHVSLDLDGLNVIAQPPEFQNNVTARITDGADKGNLTYHGVIDVSSFPVASDVEYNGVICP